MINPRVKKEWLALPRNNFDWLKKEKPEDVKRAITGLRPKPKIKRYKFFKHQLVSFLLMITQKRFMLFLDMGGGKTFLSLRAIDYLKSAGINHRAIVMVPYVITAETWLEETEKHAKHLKCTPLVYTSEKNRELLENDDADLFVICYQSAVALFSNRVEKEGAKTAKGKKKVEWKIDGYKLRQKFKKMGFNVLVMDEIHKNKNIQSQTYKMCRAISKEVEYCYGLTGTPFGRNPEDLWAQLYLVDLGDTLHTTIGFFRDVFFREEPNYWGGVKREFNKRMLPKLKEIVKNVSIRYTIDECTDMPKKSYYKKIVKPSPEMSGYYNKIIESLETLSFGRTKYRELESKYNKLRQLSSGFMTLKGDNSTKTEISFPVNPKLDALEELVESMPDDSKMIVFHHFRYTNHIISERLKKLKVKHCRVWGGNKDNLAQLRKFKTDPDVKVLVINTQAGATSQNLQMANYVVYFEQPQSSTEREQSERRAWRPGQKKRVLFFDLIMEGALDHSMKRANKEGSDLMSSILDKSTKLRKI